MNTICTVVLSTLVRVFITVRFDSIPIFFIDDSIRFDFYNRNQEKWPKNRQDIYIMLSH